MEAFMSKKISAIFSSLFVVLMIFSVFLLSACGDTKFVTVAIHQDTFDRYIIEDNKTELRIKRGDDLTLHYTITDGLEYDEIPVFNVTSSDGTVFKYDFVEGQNAFTIKNITKDVTVSWANPPSNSYNVQFYNGDSLLGTYKTTANQLVNMTWLDEIQEMMKDTDTPYLVGLYTDRALNTSFDASATVGHDINVYTKWNYAPCVFVTRTPNVDFVSQSSSFSDLTAVQEWSYFDYKIYEQPNEAGSKCSFMVTGTSELHIYNMFGTKGNDLKTDLITGTIAEGERYVYTLDATKITSSILISF